MTGYYNKQMSLLYLAIVFITTCNAIIVDWNTNKGPIVPPTTTQRPIPQKPYREPAAVWEDQSNDIPNSNPYVYVLPPPSRPKYNDIDSGYQKPQVPNTNQIIAHPNDNKGNPSVPSLTVHHIPNVGNRYVAVVPSPSTSAATNYNNNNFVTNSHSIAQSQINYNTNSDINNNNNNKWDYIKTNKLDKLNGKYSDKLRKYKSYEKFNAKFLPYYTYVQVPVKQTYYYQQQPQYNQQQQQPQIQQQASQYYQQQQQPQTFPQQINTSYKSNISKS